MHLIPILAKHDMLLLRKELEDCLQRVAVSLWDIDQQEMTPAVAFLRGQLEALRMVAGHIDHGRPLNPSQLGDFQ